MCFEGWSLEMYQDYRMNGNSVQDYQPYDQVIQTISERFITYGYHKIKTSTFENYDLYTEVNSYINRDEMIKVIDNMNQVLVLRPDVTIPITKQLAQDMKQLETEHRYFYIQDVFREPNDQRDRIERTQAGVEFFSESSPEADAEVIALAIHVLIDLGFKDIKMELGHAAFVKEIIDQLRLSQADASIVKAIIQAKNMVELESFLDSLSLNEAWKDAFLTIPLLYGNPQDILSKAKAISFTKSMEETIHYLERVYDILKMYALDQYVIMDFSLINHMGYYSDTIFQGYIDKVGKPILMGGRYNELGTVFGSTLPAIGFACDIDSIVETQRVENGHREMPLDILIKYEQEKLPIAIQYASKLRILGYQVISTPLEKVKSRETKGRYTLTLKASEEKLEWKDLFYDISSFTSLEKVLRETKE